MSHEHGSDPVSFDDLLTALATARDVHTVTDLFMWARGALWAAIPHDVLLCSVRDAQGRLIFSDALHSEPLSRRVINDLLDPVHGLLFRLQAFCRQYQLSHVQLNADGSNDELMDEDLKTNWTELQLGAVWFADAGAMAVHGSVCFALAGPRVAERRAWLPMIAGALHMTLLRVAANAQPVATTDPLLSNARESALTVRQQEILKWVRQGKSNPEIASIIGLSPFTVKNHLKIIYQKLDVSNRVQAVALQSMQAACVA
ncbi:MAG: hypothetical protein HQ446_05490 [Polaromonas sp.]|nr:hypothetical protein [Polaromonas sp.]